MDSPSQSLQIRDDTGPAAVFSPREVVLSRPMLAEGGIRLGDGASIVGSDRLRGKAIFSGDGKTRRFRINFKQEFSSEPFVVISTNQFHRCRLAEVTRSGFVVEFEAAPEPGDGNVIVWWLCVE
jgi:hypothetical protein